jgi:hypothetical protein
MSLWFHRILNEDAGRRLMWSFVVFIPSTLPRFRFPLYLEYGQITKHEELRGLEPIWQQSWEIVRRKAGSLANSDARKIEKSVHDTMGSFCQCAHSHAYLRFGRGKKESSYSAREWRAGRQISLQVYGLTLS